MVPLYNIKANWQKVILFSIFKAATCHLFFVIGFADLAGVKISSPDFSYYSEALFSEDMNKLYILSLDILNIRSMEQPRAIVISFLVSCLIDVLILSYVYSHIGKNKIIILATAICMIFHPLWIVYSVRFSTDLASKAVLVLILFHVGNFFLRHAFWVALILFREPLLIFLLVEIFLKSKKTISKMFYTQHAGRDFAKLFSALCLVGLFLAGSLILFWDYIFLSLELLGGYGWQTSDIAERYELSNSVLSFLITAVLRTLLLFGGREGTFVYGWENGDIPIIQISVVALIHAIGFLLFFILGKKRFNIGFIITPFLLFCILIILTFPHLRYLITFLPLSFIGWGMFVSGIWKILQNRNITSSQS